MNKQKLVIAFFACTILFTVISLIQDTKAATEVTNSSALQWEVSKQLTNSTNGSIRPIVATSPDGKNVIVAYMNKTGANPENADPFYSQSNDYGKNWTLNPAPIRENAGEDSRYINITIDKNRNGHAVWTENNKELWYRPQSKWASGAGADDILYQSTLIIESPKIVATGSNTLYLVWSHTDLAADNNILFAKSTNGGTSWTPTIGNAGSAKNISNSGGESILPDIAVDNSGTIHVVWQQQSTATNSKIQYANSSDGGNSWSTPINISDAVPIPDADEKLNQPRIHIAGHTIHVTFENRLTEIGELPRQNAYYISCLSNCGTSVSNWSGARATILDYSAKGTDPTFLKPQIVTSGNCPLILFSSLIDGTVSGNPDEDENETIRVSSGCEGWTKNPTIDGVDAVLGTNRRAVVPNATTANGWFIHLAFERKTGSESNDPSQIFVTRNIPAVYLPTIMK